MTLLVFKCATTGLVHFDRGLRDASQPRMMQLGAVLLTSKWDEIASIDVLIRPDGWVPNAGAAAVHGITTRQCELYGVRPKVALAMLMDLHRSAKEVAAYVWQFDASVVQIELLRAGAKPEEWRAGGIVRTSIMEKAGQKWNGGKAMKWVAAYWAATGKVYQEGRRAVDEARAAAEVLRKVRNGG